MPPYTLEEAKKQSITIYWWNNGKKTKDFEGTYEGYFEEKNIKVSEIPHSFTHSKGTRIELSASTSTATYESFSNDYVRDFNDAIKAYLMLVGDKALLETNRATFRINWD